MRPGLPGEGAASGPQHRPVRPDRPVVLEQGPAGPPGRAARDDVFQCRPVDGVVDVAGGVEVGRPDRPVASGDARLRGGQLEPGGHPVAGGGLAVEPGEVLAQRARLAGRRVDRDPQGDRLDDGAAAAGDGRGALRPARPGPGAERAQRHLLGDPRVGPDGDRAAAQQPAVGRLPAGAGHVVLGDVLQEAGQPVQPQPPAGVGVGRPHRPGPLEHPAARGSGGEQRPRGQAAGSAAPAHSRARPGPAGGRAGRAVAVSRSGCRARRSSRAGRTGRSRGRRPRR